MNSEPAQPMPYSWTQFFAPMLFTAAKKNKNVEQGQTYSRATSASMINSKSQEICFSCSWNFWAQLGPFSASWEEVPSTTSWTPGRVSECVPSLSGFIRAGSHRTIHPGPRDEIIPCNFLDVYELLHCQYACWEQSRQSCILLLLVIHFLSLVDYLISKLPGVLGMHDLLLIEFVVHETVQLSQRMTVGTSWQSNRFDLLMKDERLHQLGKSFLNSILFAFVFPGWSRRRARPAVQCICSEPIWRHVSGVSEWTTPWAAKCDPCPHILGYILEKPDVDLVAE